VCIGGGKVGVGRIVWGMWGFMTRAI
jgi:hypothetical protein